MLPHNMSMTFIRNFLVNYYIRSIILQFFVQYDTRVYIYNTYICGAKFRYTLNCLICFYGLIIIGV